MHEKDGKKKKENHKRIHLREKKIEKISADFHQCSSKNICFHQ